MKTKKPVRNTVIFGLIAGLLSLPVSMAIAPYLYWPRTVAVVISLTLLCYGFLLCRWSDTDLGKLLFPGLLLIGASLAGTPPHVFVLLALIVLAWIRSSLCYPRSPGAGIIIEAFMNGIGLLLIVFFNPFAWYGTFSIGAEIWLFFLIQSLYFLFFQQNDTKKLQKNSFVRARRVAEKILAVDGI